MKKLILSGIIGCITLISTPAIAGKNSIHIKTGDYSLDNTNQVILNRAIDIKEKDNGYIAIEYQYKFDNNLSIGGDFIKLEHEYTQVSNGNTGDIFTNLILFNLKYHFDAASWLQPFVGVSAGVVSAELEGPIFGDAIGTATGLGAGLAFVFTDTVGFTIEYKQINAEPEDTDGTVVDVSGSSITGALSLTF